MISFRSFGHFVQGWTLLTSPDKYIFAVNFAIWHYIAVTWVLLGLGLRPNFVVFTARSWDRNTVRPSVGPSVRHTRALWQKERTHCRCFDTTWKSNHCQWWICQIFAAGVLPSSTLPPLPHPSLSFAHFLPFPSSSYFLPFIPLKV